MPPTAELPPRYALVRPPLLTPENAAAAAAASASSSAASSAASTPTMRTPLLSASSLHAHTMHQQQQHQYDLSPARAAYYMSPLSSSALADFETWTRDSNVHFGHDIHHVPLKHGNNNNITNLVLSNREFHIMATRLPHYEEMEPEALIEAITQLLKDDDATKELDETANNNNSSATYFQARIRDLDQEKKRLDSKLKVAHALQKSVSDENTALRVTVRSLEASAVDTESLRLENDVLRDQAVAAATNVARMKKIAADARLQAIEFATELKQLRMLVDRERDAMNNETAAAFASVVDRVTKREQILQQSVADEKTERQRIAEQFYELSGRIRVFCRLRPPLDNDAAVALVRPTPNSVLIERSAKEFAFDHVFGSESTQRDVYQQVSPLVVSFVDGFNACIMAYGQTGTGKTFTMMGNRHDRETEGVIPRALQHVFALVDARPLTFVDRLDVSMVEIYNDQLLDLLHDDATRTSKGASVKNEADVTLRSVTHWSHVDAVLTEGNANRNIAATSMNVESSRSHALVFLHLTSQHRITRETKRSTMCLVDLAGSERIARSQVEGERLKETQHINKSLAALGDVVHALQHKAKHTPYRNSKLTYMLRDMLSGQAKTLLMLQLSPDADDVDETTCSLQFGARVSQVQLGAVRPSVESGELVKLRDTTKALATKLEAAETKSAEWKYECHYKTEQLADARAQTKALEQQLRDRQMQDAQSSVDGNDTALALDLLLTASMSPPASPRSDSATSPAPSSPTPSVRSTRSTTSTASLPVTLSTTSRLAQRKPLSANTRSVASSSASARSTTATQRDTVLDAETRRKSLSTLPTRTSSTLSSRSIRASREAPTSLPSRKPLASAPSTSVPASPASTSRIARPRSSLGGTSTAASSSTPTPSSGAPRAPLRRTNSLASSAGSTASSNAARSTTATTTTTSRRPLSTRSASSARSSSATTPFR